MNHVNNDYEIAPMERVDAWRRFVLLSKVGGAFVVVILIFLAAINA